MRRATIALWAALACPALPAVGGSPAMAIGTDFNAILDVCEATTLREAAAKGERLGWPAAPEDQDWRAGFERYNGGMVQVVGWRRGDRDDLLSYWVASGRNAHTACAFVTDQPGLLDALRDRFGPPEQFEEHGDIVSAFWRRGAAEVSFAQVGASSSLNVSRRG